MSKLRVEQPSTDAPPVMLHEVRSDVARLRAHVLVIDDEPLICAILESILADDLVEAFVKPRDALARALQACFDVIFCDLNMPDMTGLELFIILEREVPSAIPHFVLMSGSVGHDESVRTLCGRGVPVLAKPFCIADVEGHVARLMASKVQ